VRYWTGVIDPGVSTSTVRTTNLPPGTGSTRASAFVAMAAATAFS